MPTINQLASISQVSGSAQIPVYDQNNGDARKMSVNTLLDYFQTSFAAPTVATNLYTPGAGFNITVPTPVAEQQWMLIQPAGTLATGTVTLPLNTGVPDGTEVLITSTQTITAFTIALNGAAAIFGNVSTLTAGAAVRYRYYLATNSWYNITNETAGFNAAIQAFLNNPTSANLRAAMTDETGTGVLVFATSPTLTTPIITNPAVSTGTFTSPALVTPDIGSATGNSLMLSGASGSLNATSIAANNDLTANNSSIATFIAMSGGVNTVASATTIAPVKRIAYISGTAAIATITPQAPITGTNGTIILIPTGAFTWTTAGNIAIAGTAVVGRALHMTYTAITDKWYPSYV